MYDLRDWGTYAVLLLVLPVFAVVFAVACLVLLPMYIVWEVIKRVLR